MMQLNNDYQRDDFIKFLEEDFLTDFKRDVRPVNTSSLACINKAQYLGESKTLDLQVFEFVFEGSANKRVALTKDAFSVMRSSAIYNALAIFHSGDKKDWRFSLLTATPEPTEKGKVSLTYSNPKRLSFFLGPNAKVNTPTKFLISKGKIVDFDDLKSRFSIEVVNKEFYKEISQAFTKLVSGVLKLPSTQDKSQTNLEFAVRLIGRIIFCWFLREKKSDAGLSLMPQELLSVEAVQRNKDYYHTILEPIFFEVLNKPVKSRREEFAKESFSLVPYLNGGLFSPQEDDFYKRMNGDFQSQFHNTLVISDLWLNNFFEILETYNFTMDENTSYDEELSIDPEMLGRIFENLLAEINPETGESARKSTGSYYTPRTIVNYMVDESLLLYLKEQTGIKEETLRAIISYDLSDDSENPVTLEEKENIIEALEKVKILDPACGSGAFPIGALQKIVFILQQIDPDGRMWFKKQVANASPEFRRDIEKKFSNNELDFIRKLGVIRKSIYGVDIQPIATEISRLRCFLTLIVDEFINDKENNRGIKPLPNLDFKFVTANSLIGLPRIDDDPQQLLFDERANIQKLRSLMDDFFSVDEHDKYMLMNEFHQVQKELIKQYFSQKDYASSDQKRILADLGEWDPFTRKPSTWFDPEWMFGTRGGFNIVIANPPYVRADNPDFKEQRELIKKSGLYRTLYEKWDLFLPFIERGLELFGENGCLCYITSNSLLSSKFAFRLLDFIQANYYTQFLDYFSDDTKVFEAGVIPVVFGVTNKSVSKVVRKTSHKGRFENVIHKEYIPVEKFRSEGKDVFKPLSIKLALTVNNIPLGNICYMSVGMVINADEKTAKGEFAKNDLISDIKTDVYIKKYIEGKDIERYKINEIRFLEWNTARVPNKIRRPTFPELYDRPKIMRGRVTEGVWDETGLVCNDSIVVFVRFTDLENVNNKSIASSIHKFNSISRGELEDLSRKFDLKYILAILNSKFANVFLNNVRRHRLKNYFYPDDFRKLPIADISLSEQKIYADLVNKTILLKKNDDEESRRKSLDIEAKIDQMIYKLYGLTEEEIKTVEETGI